MADKYVNEVGLRAIKTWVEGKFALDTELDALDAKVDEIIAEGGEPNVIETVKVDNNPLTPDANKAVNIDLSGKANVADIPTATSDLTNDGDGDSNFATESYVDQHGGKIDVIQVNGTAQTITNKTVNIPVPTATSDLTNDSDFQDSTDVENAINSKISSVYKAKGSIAFSQLPTLTASNEGFVYDINESFETTADFVEGAGKTYPAGTNVVIINTSGSTYKYDVLTGVTDLSNYWTSESGQSNSLVAMTVAEINAILEPSA